MQYTRGPWRIEMQENYMKLYMPGPLKGDVARGYIGKGNAKLIEAAPEMYEALKAFIREKDRHSDHEYDAVYREVKRVVDRIEEDNNGD
jgi:hypothetical protein